MNDLGDVRERILWVDAAKGIGIAMVVFSHLTEPGQGSRTFVFSFHMPLFFFLSGVVFSTINPGGGIFKKEAETSLFPISCISYV